MRQNQYEITKYHHAIECMLEFENTSKDINYKNFKKFVEKKAKAHEYVYSFQHGAKVTKTKARDLRGYSGSQTAKEYDVTDVEYYVRKFIKEPWSVQQEFWKIYKSINLSHFESNKIKSKVIFDTIKKIKGKND